MTHNVQPQHVAVMLGKRLQLIDGAMGAFAKAIGITVRMKTSFKQRLNDVAECMMDNPIAERSRTDLTALGEVDKKVAIIAGHIALGSQPMLQHEQFIGQLKLKTGNRCPAPFTSCGFMIR